MTGDIIEAEAFYRLGKAEKIAAKLEYWLDTDDEVLADMTPEVRSDHDHIHREVRKILAALRGVKTEDAGLGIWGPATMAMVTSPEFVLDAIDSVHDMDVTLTDYAAAVSRSQRAALGIQTKGGKA
jgi:hypothetical protein